MTANVKVSGVWKSIDGIHIKDAGVWHEVDSAYIKAGGIWKKCFDGVVRITLSGSNANVNLNSLVTAALGYTPTSPIKVVLTNNGIIYSAIPTGTNQNKRALSIDSLPVGSMITIINNGYIYGYGGRGVSPGWDDPTVNDGGPAIYTARDITIENNGYIFGGGGGGGCGGAARGLYLVQSTAEYRYYHLGGGGGGGGAGFDGGPGGLGQNSSTPSVWSSIAGQNGSAGSSGGRGAGGASGNINGISGGPGGYGGDWGAAGYAGGVASTNYTYQQYDGFWNSVVASLAPMPAGAAGLSIKKSSAGLVVAFTAGGDSTHLKGAIST